MACADDTKANATAAHANLIIGFLPLWVMKMSISLLY
jgi:hypothetical protein